MKKIARMLRAHRQLLLNYFKAKKQLSSTPAKRLFGIRAYCTARSVCKPRARSVTIEKASESFPLKCQNPNHGVNKITE